MSKIKIKYTYTPELTQQIYIESARRATEATIEVDETQLSPHAREAALTALVCREASYCTPRIGAVPDTIPETLESLEQFSRYGNPATIEWSDPVGTEPDANRALADVEAALVISAVEAPAVLARVARLREERKRAEVATREAEITAILAHPIGHWICAGEINYAGSSQLRDRDPRLQARLREVETEIGRRDAAAEAEKTARAAERAAGLKRWIEEHAPGLLPRHREGLLPEREADDVIREWLLGSIAWERYKRLHASDVEHGEHCCRDDSSVEFSARDAAELAASEYEALIAIRERAAALPVPGAAVAAREHSAICQDSSCEEPLDRCVRRSALVTVSYLGRDYSREFPL